MNITCTVAYPHEDWSRLAIESGDGQTSFTLWRNATTYLKPSSGFALISNIEEYSVVFSVVFEDDSTEKCHSSGNYTCVLVAHAITVTKAFADVSITGKYSREAQYAVTKY